MMDNSISKPESEELSSTKIKTVIIITVILILAIGVGMIYFLLRDPARTETIRDIFIIFLGLELFIIGATTVLLIIQAARLVNMFQHEIKPVLESTNETLSTIRGTTIFISESLVQPVIKINSLFATIRRALELLNLNPTAIEKILRKE